MKLEGIEVINDWLLRQVKLVPGEDLSLMIMARFSNQECIRYYDESVSPGLQRELGLADMDFPTIGALLDLLKSRYIRFKMGHYKTYVFPTKLMEETDLLCLPNHDARVKAFGFDGLAEQVYASQQNGVLVSTCISARENESCGEAWVYTTPEYRKQRFAQKVVRVWAESLLNAGKIPFHSQSDKEARAAA